MKYAIIKVPRATAIHILAKTHAKYPSPEELSNAPGDELDLLAATMDALIEIGEFDIELVPTFLREAMVMRKKFLAQMEAKELQERN